MLEQFLRQHTISGHDNGRDSKSCSTDPVSITGALISQGEGTLLMEVDGTQYLLGKTDVLAIELASHGVVTKTGIGLPVSVSIQSEALLHRQSRIAARNLRRIRPLALARPSQVGSLTIDPGEITRDRDWLVDRGISLSDDPGTETDTASSSNSSTMSDYYTPTTSPSTYQPELDSWTTDDQENAGQAPDDSDADDTESDDQASDDPGS